MPHVPTILLLSPSSLLPCPPRDVCISAGRTWSFQNRQLVLLHHLMFRLVRSSRGRNANRGWRDQLRGCPWAVFITFSPANADTASCISMVTALYSPPQEADTGETAARGEKGCIKEASPPLPFQSIGWFHLTVLNVWGPRADTDPKLWWHGCSTFMFGNETWSGGALSIDWLDRLLCSVNKVNCVFLLECAYRCLELPEA